MKNPSMKNFSFGEIYYNNKTKWKYYDLACAINCTSKLTCVCACASACNCTRLREQCVCCSSPMFGLFYIACMDVHFFPTVKLDKVIQFSTFSRMSGFLWHSPKQARWFGCFLQYTSGLEVLACILNIDLNYVSTMLQLHPPLNHSVKLPKLGVSHR